MELLKNLFQKPKEAKIQGFSSLTHEMYVPARNLFTPPNMHGF